MIDQRLYPFYKPLRNHLNKVGIENALYVIWAYINLFQMKQDLPSDIEHAKEIYTDEWVKRGVYEWELALLARQMLVLGEEYGPMARKNLNKWNYFVGAVNKIKDFENNISKLYHSVESVLGEMRRVAPRQFSWQVNKVSTSLFLRYYKIYSHPPLAAIIQEILGLSIQKWYTVGTAVLGAFFTNPKMTVDPAIQIHTLTFTDFQNFFDYVSTDLKSIQNNITETVHINNQFVYAFNPLEYSPLVLINGYYYCPITTFLGWRITSGIYYDLVDDPRFANPYGEAFKKYALEIAKAILTKPKFQILDENQYGSSHAREDSIDIIVADNKAVFFIEAKTIRRSSRSRTQLLTNDQLGTEAARIAEAVCEAYATIADYLENKYPHFPYNSNLKIYPILLTLEDPFFFDGEDVLKNKIKGLLSEKSLPESYTESMPYTICSIDEYERLIQVSAKEGIEPFMQKWLPHLAAQDNFGAYLGNAYNGQWAPIDDFFPGDFEKIYPEGVMGIPQDQTE